MLLDAGCTFAANHTLVHRVIAVAIDICNFAIFQMHFDAATACTHVTRGGLNFVPIFRRSVDFRLGEDSHQTTIAKQFEAHYGPYFSSLLGQPLAFLASGTIMEPILKLDLNNARLAYSY